ncbi:NlpC/P60 family protein [Bifidobacterium tibiigranuli]|uniref:Peptidoglycan hydrolase n=1 Tax=Bifidobacterium tibiigranuli TaxID=2172043 RepID=A0A5N6RY69_9BIFI|nr:NlpC/P60 family protein [Bifidobacterium tibiigranuli]KAE8127282.1 peptidoglycan hydrolase [Bifidobacterium tibiigranuli]KAE8129673.1 peptidoglycan hydrolase [Bifidobacterium tibiigranuli]
MGNLNTLINRMRYWCQTVSLGYSQNDRWNIRPGGNCDCSSLVIWCLREAGFDTGSATYTGNMSAQLTARGWSRIANDGNPQAGDILLNDRDHVAVYLGGGQLAQASYSEHRTATGQGGDQTGQETNIRAYYDFPWNCYLRYTGGTTPTPTPAASNKLTVDGDCGPATVRRWQQVMGTTADGVISGQLHPDGTYARPNLYAVAYGPGGSDLIRAVQRRLGLTADGLMGPGTIKAIQRHLGVTPDGSFGPATVRALQSRLNTNTF